MTTIMIHEYDDDDDDDDDEDDDGDADENGNEAGVRLMLMMMMMIDNSLFFTSICHQDIFRWVPPTKPIYNSKYVRTMLLHHITLAKSNFFFIVILFQRYTKSQYRSEYV